MPASGGVIQMPLFKKLSVVGGQLSDDESAGNRQLTTDNSISAISIPARSFTGDFYFTHRYADRLWFALGDVAGKGLPAAVIMAMIQEELEHRIESCAITRCHPSATMQRLHTFLRPLVPRNRFATAVIGHLCDDGTLEIANGGHCPPLIVRGDAIERVPSTGPALGPIASPQWQTFQTALAPGDALVLYSDGVVESPSPDGEEFGMQRLEESLRGGPASAGLISRNILDAVDRHSRGCRADDLTLVVVRNRPES